MSYLWFIQSNMKIYTVYVYIYSKWIQAFNVVIVVVLFMLLFIKHLSTCLVCCVSYNVDFHILALKQLLSVVVCYLATGLFALPSALKGFLKKMFCAIIYYIGPTTLISVFSRQIFLWDLVKLLYANCQRPNRKHTAKKRVHWIYIHQVLTWGIQWSKLKTVCWKHIEVAATLAVLSLNEWMNTVSFLFTQNNKTC